LLCFEIMVSEKITDAPSPDHLLMQVLVFLYRAPAPRPLDEVFREASRHGPEPDRYRIHSVLPPGNGLRFSSRYPHPSRALFAALLPRSCALFGR